MMAHSKGILKIYPIPNTKCVITLGKGSHTISMWTINTDAVDENNRRGGVGLLPFCRSLPGGPDGWLFREMQALFYYMQIMTSSLDSPEAKQVGNTIAMSEAPDYLRALGYFPSNKAAKDILCELSDQRPQLAKHLRVTFGELLKVYVNHKPLKGYDIDYMMQSISFCSTSDNTVETSDLMDVCCAQGEAMGRVECAMYLRLLLEPDDHMNVERFRKKSNAEEEILNEIMQNLPEAFNVHEFLRTLFGLSMNASKELVFADVIDPGTVDAQLDNNVRNNSDCEEES